MNDIKDKKLKQEEVEKINGGWLPSGGTQDLNEHDTKVAKTFCELGLIKHGKVIKSDGSKLSVGTECGGTIRIESHWYSPIIKFRCSKCGGWHYSWSKNHIDTLEEFDLDPSSKALLEQNRQK